MSGSIQQSGPVVAGHFGVFVKDGALQDSGPASGGIATEIGITNSGSLAFAVNSGVISGPYTQYGVSVDSDGTIVVSAGGFNGGSPAVLLYELNGTSYPFNPAGVGNISGPGTSVSGDLLAFVGTQGNLVSDTGIQAARVTQGPTASVVGDLPTFSDTTGNAFQDSGVLVASVVQGPTVAVSGDLPSFNGTGGTTIQDSGVLAANVVQNTGGTVTAGILPSFSGTGGRLLQSSGIPAARVVQGPTVAVSGDLATFNGTGGSLVQDGGVALASLLSTVANIAALRLATTTTLPVPQCYVLGFAGGGDGGDGAFWYNSSDVSSTDNGITIFVDASNRRWYRQTMGAPLNIAWAGGTPAATGTTNATALNNALAALPGGGGNIVFGPGKYTFASSITYNYPSGKFAVALVGAGADVTILYWAAHTGITLNASNAFHSVHVRDLTFSTGSAGTYSALALNNSVLEGTYGQSDIENVTFRGDDGGQATDYWAFGVIVTGWSNFNYESVLIYGNAAGTGGAGIVVAGNAATSPYYSLVHNFIVCGFYNLGTGIYYGTYIQGVTVSQCNFVNGTTGILISSAETGSSQLTVLGCNFNVSANQISILSPLAGLFATGNLFYVPANAAGIYLNSTGNFATITGNIFTGLSLTGSVGVLVNANFSTGVMTSNVFTALADGSNLTGTSTWNVQANKYMGCTVNVANTGSNSVGVATS
jgi:hypothetical protein